MWYGELGDRSQLIATLNHGVVMVARVGRPEAAAVMAGVVVDGPLAELDNFPVGGYERGDRVLGPIAAELGAARFEAACARGAVMAYQDVIDFALLELDDALSELGDG